MHKAWLLVTPLALAGCGEGDAGRDFGRDDPRDRSPGVEFDPVLYPPPPHGTGEWAVIQNLAFLGWKDPSAANWDPHAFETVALSDFYDAEGSERRFVFMTVVEVWCPWCREIYKDVRNNDRYTTYRAQGVDFLGVLTENAEREPAIAEDLVVWSRDMYDVRYPMVLDPGFKTAGYHDNAGTPLSMLIDVRDMRILFKMNGVPGDTGVAGLFERMGRFIDP